MSAPNPVWTDQSIALPLASKVSQRLKSISRPLNNNLKLTDLTPEAQAALMGREYDNLCVHNPSSSNEQNLRTFERHGGDSYREMRQNSDTVAIAQEHDLALEIDRKLASKNDSLDHALAKREAIEEAINEKEIRYLMAREETEFTTEPPEAGVSEQSNQEILSLIHI